MSVNTDAGHRMMEYSKAVNVSATVTSQTLWLHAWNPVVLELCLGVCWGPLSIGGGEVWAESI